MALVQRFQVCMPLPDHLQLGLRRIVPPNLQRNRIASRLTTKRTDFHWKREWSGQR